MKKTIVFALAVMSMLVGAVVAEKMALVLDPFIPIYRERQPGSEIMITASKGDKFHVSRVGENWVQVFVPPNNEKGWMELGIENPKVKIAEKMTLMDSFGSLVYWIFFLALLGIGFFILRHFQHASQKKALKNAGDAAGH